MSDRKITQFDIQGRTMVNMVDEEPSGAPMIEVNSKSSVLMDAGLNDSKIIPHNGVPMKEAYMYGNTLVNLMTNCKDEYVVRYHDFNNPNNTVANISMMKPNTEYTLFYKAKYRTEGEGAGTQGGLKIATSIEEGFMGARHSYTTEYKQYIQKITTSSVVDCFVFASNGSYFAIKECVLLEGDHTQEDIPYFEGMKSVEAPVFTSIGKNLVDYTDTSLHVNGTTILDGKLLPGGDFSSFLKIPNLKIGKIYRISVDIELVEGYTIADSALVLGVSNSANNFSADYGSVLTGPKSGRFSMQFTATQTTVYLQGRLGQTIAKYSNIIIVDNSDGSITTDIDYEPYKVNTLAVPSDLVLRKVGDYADKLDLNTGKLVRYIREIILNGSESWYLYNNFTDDGYSSFVVDIPTLNNLYTHDLCCISENFVPGSWHYYINNRSTEMVWNHDPNKIGIRVKNEKASTEAGIKQWLSQNPIKVQYVLATPEITTIPLTSNGNYNHADTNTLKNANWSADGSGWWFNGYNDLMPQSDRVFNSSYASNKLISVYKRDDYNTSLTTSGAGYIEFYLKGSSNQDQLKEFIEDNNIEVYSRRQDGQILNNKCKLPMYFKSGTIQTSTANSILPTIKYSIPTENYYQLDRAIMNKLYTIQGTGLVNMNSANTDTNLGTYISKITNNLTVNKVYYPDGYWKRDLVIVEGDQTQVDFPTFYGLKNVVMNEVKTVGKNLVDMTKFVPGRLDNGLLGYTDDTTDYEFFSNTSMSKFTVNTGYRGVVSDYIKVMPNTNYTISWQSTNSNFGAVGVAIYDKNKKWLTDIYRSNQSLIITAANSSYFRIWCYLTSAGTTQFRIQLEKGNSFTGFEPYQELAINTANTELMGIEDDKDIVNLNTNTKTQKYGKIVLNGSEDWSFVKLEPGGKYAYTLTKSNAAAKGIGICDKFKYTKCDNYPWDKKENSISVLTQKDINIYTDITTLTEFKSWLADNNVTLVYELDSSVSTSNCYDSVQVSNLLNSPLKSIQIPSEISPITTLKVEAPEKQTVSTQSLPSGKMYCDTTPVVVKGDYTNSTLPQNLTLSTATNSEIRIDGVTYKLIGTDLRSVPNGVKDELDIKRGKLIRRVGKIESTNLPEFLTLATSVAYSGNNCIGAFWRHNDTTAIYTDGIPLLESDNMCNIGYVSGNILKLDSANFNDIQNAIRIAKDTASYFLAIKVSKDLVSSIDTEGFNEFIQSNPFSIYYPLATPTETPIQILTQAEYGALETKPEIYVLASEKSKSVFSNSYISTSSENSVNAEVNYTVPMYNYYAANKLDFDTEYKLVAVGNDITNMELNGEIVTLTNDKLTTPSKTNFTKRIIKLPNMFNKFAGLMLLKAEANMPSLHRVFQKMQSVLNPKLVNQIEVKDSTLELHSLPNGVCDELDMITGRYVKRVEKIELFGDTEFSIDWNRVILKNPLRYKVYPWASEIINSYCSMLEVVNHYNVINNTREYVFVEKLSNESFKIEFCNIGKRLLNSSNPNEFKQWLSDNQVFVLLELQTPEVSYIDLNKYQLIDNRQVQTENIYVEEGQTLDSNGYYIKPTLNYTLENNSELVTNPLSNTENERVISDLVVKGNTLKNLISSHGLGKPSVGGYTTVNLDSTSRIITLTKPANFDGTYWNMDLFSGPKYSPAGKVFTFVYEVLESQNMPSCDLLTTIGKHISTKTWSTSSTTTTVGIQYNDSPNNTDTERIYKVRIDAIIEGDYTNYPISYFEGLKHVENPVVKVSNKNLWEPIYADLNKGLTSCKLTDKFLVFNANQDNIPPVRMDVKFCGNEILVKNDGVKTISLGYRMENLKPNTTYTISCLVDMPNNIKNIKNCYMPLLGANGYSSGNRLYRVFNTNQNGTMIKFRPDFSGNMNPLISVWNEYQKFNGTMRIYDIQLHEGNFSAVNPPLEGTVYSANTTLYSTPMLSDELDMNTGKLTRRLGRVVLNGSEDEEFSTVNNTDGTVRFHININAKPMSLNWSKNLLNKYIQTNVNTGGMINTTDYSEPTIAMWSSSIVIHGTKCNTVDALKTYLQSNPIEVIYPLATPTIEDVTITKSSNQIPVLRSPEANSVVSTNSIVRPSLNIRGKKYRIKGLKPATNYIVRFALSGLFDTNTEETQSTTLTIDLGGKTWSNEYTSNSSIEERVAITTNTLLNHKAMYIKSTNPNIKISEVMVVPNTNITRIESGVFFEGISSTGNAEDNVIKINNNGTVSEVKLNNRLRRLSDTVYDEYIPERGVIIRHVGKVILDGSEEWLYAIQQDKSMRFGLIVSDFADYGEAGSGKGIICDKLSVIKFVEVMAFGISTWKNRFIVYNDCKSLDEFKAKLAKDPITVYYELATPEVVTVTTEPTQLSLPVYQTNNSHTVTTNNTVLPTLTFKSNAYYELSAQGRMLLSCICEEDVTIEINNTEYTMTLHDPYSPNLRTVEIDCTLDMRYIQVVNQGVNISSFLVTPVDSPYHNYVSDMEGSTSCVVKSTGRNLCKVDDVTYNNVYLSHTKVNDNSLTIRDTMCSTGKSETYINMDNLRNGYYVASAKLDNINAIGNVNHSIKLGFLSSINKSVSIGDGQTASGVIKSNVFHITNANEIKAITIIDDMVYTGTDPLGIAYENTADNTVNEGVIAANDGSVVDVSVNTAEYTISELVLRRFNTANEALAYEHHFDVYAEDTYDFTSLMNNETKYSVTVDKDNKSVYYADVINMTNGKVTNRVDVYDVAYFEGLADDAITIEDSSTSVYYRFAVPINQPNATLNYKPICNKLETVSELIDANVEYLYQDSENSKLIFQIFRDTLYMDGVTGFKDWLKRKNIKVLTLKAEPTTSEVNIDSNIIRVKPYSNIQVKDRVPAILGYIPFKLQEPLRLPSSNRFTLIFTLEGSIPAEGRILFSCVDSANLRYEFVQEFEPKSGENRVLIDLDSPLVITNEFLGIDCHNSTISDVIMLVGDYVVNEQVHSGRRLNGLESVLEADKSGDEYPIRIRANEEVLSIGLDAPLRGIPNGVYDEIDYENSKLIRRVEELVINPSTIVSEGQITHNGDGTIDVPVVLPSATMGINRVLSSRYPAVNMNQYILMDYAVPYTNIAFLTDHDTNLSTMWIDNYKGTYAELVTELETKPIKVIYNKAEAEERDLGSLSRQLITQSGETIVGSTNSLPPYINYTKAEFHLRNTIDLKPNTQYTAIFTFDKRTSRADVIRVGLGGTIVTTPMLIGSNRYKVLVTTPSTLVSDYLSIDGEMGAVSNIMLFEGDYTQDNNIPLYLSNIQSAGEIQADSTYVITVKAQNNATEGSVGFMSSSLSFNIGYSPLLSNNETYDEISYDLVSKGYKLIRRINKADMTTLAEPVITDIVPTGELTTYDNLTKLRIVGNIPAELDLINLEYKVKLEPSTTYTVVVYSKYLGQSGSVTVNLGGTTTTFTTDSDKVEHRVLVTTPAILSHSKLILSGARNTAKYVKVIKGDQLDANLPIYFDGIKSAGENEGELRVTTTDKNQFDLESRKVTQCTNIAVINIGSNSVKTKALYSNNEFGFSDRTDRISFANMVTLPHLRRGYTFTMSFKAKKVSGTGTIDGIYLYGHYDFDVDDPYNVVARLEGENVPYLTTTAQQYSVTFTTKAGYEAVYPYFRVSADASNLVIELSDIQIEYGDTATEYEPFARVIQTIKLDKPLRKYSDSVYDEISNGRLLRRVGVDEDGSLYALDMPVAEEVHYNQQVIMQGNTDLECLNIVIPKIKARIPIATANVVVRLEQKVKELQGQLDTISAMQKAMNTLLYMNLVVDGEPDITGFVDYFADQISKNNMNADMIYAKYPSLQQAIQDKLTTN